MTMTFTLRVKQIFRKGVFRNTGIFVVVNRKQLPLFTVYHNKYTSVAYEKSV